MVGSKAIGMDLEGTAEPRVTNDCAVFTNKTYSEQVWRACIEDGVGSPANVRSCVTQNNELGGIELDPPSSDLCQQPTSSNPRGRTYLVPITIYPVNLQIRHGFMGT